MNILNGVIKEESVDIKGEPFDLSDFVVKEEASGDVKQNEPNNGDGFINIKQEELPALPIADVFCPNTGDARPLLIDIDQESNSNLQELTPRPSMIEELTSQWIRASCQKEEGSRTNRADLYSAYVDDMRKEHNALPGSLFMFTNMLKSTFNGLEYKLIDGGFVMIFNGLRLNKPHEISKERNGSILKENRKSKETVTPQVDHSADLQSDNDYQNKIDEDDDRSKTGNKIHRGKKQRESEEHEDGIVRKREKASHELADQLNRMYETMVNYRTQDGLELCDAFIQLPNRRELPEYYETISNPMDFAKIKRKIASGRYSRAFEMGEDVQLLCDNAKIYNVEGSDIYSNAIRIETIWKEIVGKEIMKKKKEEKADIGDERSLMSDDQDPAYSAPAPKKKKKTAAKKAKVPWASYNGYKLEVKCDSCKSNLTSTQMRFTCTLCPNFDQCLKCTVKGQHSEHALVRYSDADTLLPTAQGPKKIGELLKYGLKYEATKK